MNSDAKSTSDGLTRFLFDNLHIRGEITHLQQSYQDVLSQQNYPKPIQTLLGEFMAAAALLSATLKFEGNLILQIKTRGQVSVLMAECRSQQFLRAIARYEEDPDKPLLSSGQLAITIEPADGERYQGIVSFENVSLASALEQYFQQSEQLRTRLWLAADGQQAAGLLLQELPVSSDEETRATAEEDWQRLSLLTDTTDPKELLELDGLELLRRLYHEETVRVFDPAPLSFACTCSPERTAQVLVNLGQDNAREIIQEQGRIEMNCQFCHKQYVFTENDVNRLFQRTLH